MNNLQEFNFKGNNVRTVQIDNEPYFVGKDVASILNYMNTAKAIRDHVDDEDKLSERIVLSGQNREAILINESGLYSLILSSKLPTAKEFKHWVTSEVLPSIRKHGAYMTDQKAYDITHNKDSLADLLLQAGEQLKRKDAQITEMKPKAEFADQIRSSKDTILMRDLAKLLYKNGIAIGQKELFRYMVENDYLIKRNNSYTPSQKSVKLGILDVNETTVLHRFTSPEIKFTPLITTKGQKYFIGKFLKANKKVEA